MLSHLATHLYGAPLLLHRSKLDTILGVLGHRIGLNRETYIQLPMDGPNEALDIEDSVPGVAVIPICGTLVKRTMGLEAQSGLVSYTSIASQVASAVADPAVQAILLDIDSSGGESSGVFDLADAIYASREAKPIWAVANDSCFSAAYAIASAADRVFVTRTGGVGSIGVIALHVDQSVSDTNEGLTYTAICAGAHKNDLTPHAPLADGAKAALQGEVNRIYSLFTQTVARNRGCSASFVAATDAALFFGPDAVAAGLADGVASYAEVLNQLTQSLSMPAVTSVVSTLSQENTMQHNEVPAISAESPSPPTIAAPATSLASTPQAPRYEQAVEIAQLCQIAGMPDKTAEFLSSGASVAQVRQMLLSARAATPVISSHIDPISSGQSHDVLMRVLKQRLSKE